jgi:hypothetical protein
VKLTKEEVARITRLRKRAAITDRIVRMLRPIASDYSAVQMQAILNSVARRIDRERE